MRHRHFLWSRPPPTRPVFGMSDTYLGHGIVGGDVMNFAEQGKVTARIVSELLEGKKAAGHSNRDSSEYVHVRLE